MANKKTYKLDKICLIRTKNCLKVIFPSCFSDSSLYFTLLLGICLGQQIIIYNVGLLPSQYFSSLGEKNWHAFVKLLYKSFLFIIAVSIYNSVVKYITGSLHLIWRQLLTNLLHEKYFFKKTLYSLNVLDLKLDNVDQRITQDVDRFAIVLSDMAPKLIISPLTIIYYSVQCFNATGYMGPVIIYAYFTIATIANQFIVSYIVPLVFKQERAEGNFRYKHSQIRMNAESIAFMKGERNEHAQTGKLFNILIDIQKSIVHKEILINMMVNFCDYLGSILSYVIISVPIFSGSYDHLNKVELASLISKNAFVSMYLINCFSSLIDFTSKFTDFFGYSHRIGELSERLQVENDTSYIDHRNLIDGDKNDKLMMSCENLTFLCPDTSKTLISELSLKIHSHENILVTGGVGSGKTTLLRHLRYLQVTQQGEISILNDKNCFEVFFLPQVPYLSDGSLTQLIIYPNVESEIKDREMVNIEVEKALQLAGLTELQERLAHASLELSNNRWEYILSPGEVQKICFARLFYHRPKLAFLDEATSSLSVSDECSLYTTCKRIGVTFVSVGHRESLKKLHEYCLHLHSDGTWKMSTVQQTHVT